MTKEKKRRKAKVEQFLDLVWELGEAQADFGETDFIINEVKKRIYYFVLSFPHSNVGLAQVLPGENAECVCQGLKAIFEFIGGVPNRIVFDNATGVGRKVANGVRTTQNSKVRASFSEDLQSYFDSLSKADLREELRLLHRESDKSGWEAINFDLKTRKERKRTRLINGAKFPALKSFES